MPLKLAQEIGQRSKFFVTAKPQARYQCREPKTQNNFQFYRRVLLAGNQKAVLIERILGVNVARFAYNKPFKYAPTGPDYLTRRFALGKVAA